MNPDLLLPEGFQMWSPAVQATTLFLGTFVLEDVAAIGAGLLLATGGLAWPVAFWACFLGIWIGDAGLYALARFGGRTWFERSRWKRFEARVNQSEEWFGQRGDAILVFSRLLPGARLPTYLAAGFLRWPIKRFLLITGSASLLWTVLILAVTQVAGARVLSWAKQWQHGSGVLLSALAGAAAVLFLVKQVSWAAVRNRLSAALGRWAQWEFWPSWMFYPPVALYVLWLGIKYRGLTLPTAANPGIFSGGLVGESKMATLHELHDTSPEFTAEAELLAEGLPGERLESLREICHRRGLTYPLILKPDLGQRGAGVKLIRNAAQALAYFRQTGAPLLIQRYSPGPREAGVFYYRHPDEPNGCIFAITEKCFPTVAGDGMATIEELIRRDPRARLIADKYLQRFAGRHGEVLPAGESLKLVEAGNHAQGCIFKDGAHLITPELTGRMDEISQRLNGFFIGRYDIRYASDDDLRAGKNFQIIELNGAAAEATSIYDSRNSLRTAYRILFRQWELVYAIGAANRARGTPSMSLREIWRAWRAFAERAESYPAAD